MRVAIAHDYLTQRGGAERAVLSLSDAYPGAAIHTSLYDPEATFDEFRTRQVRTSPINRISLLRHHHRVGLPLYPVVFRQLRIDADVTICSSSGWAHGASVSGRKLVYCYAPPRWLHQEATYLGGFSPAVGAGLRVLKGPLLRWDRTAAAGADRYLAISTRSRDLIRTAYGIDAEVLAPPHSIDATGPRRPVDGLEPGFHLCVSRLLSYKNVPQLVEAFRSRPDRRLVLVGDGPLAGELAARAPANVVLLGRVTDDELRWLYAEAAALVAVSYEDLGLTPIEAAMFATPTLALRFGGYLDTIIEGVNGAFVDDPDPAHLASALDRFDPASFEADAVAASAERFSRARFEARLRAIVTEVLRAGPSH